MSNLTTVGGNFWLEYLSIPNLSGLENLTSVGGELLIFGCSLTDISALANLNNIGSLNIQFNGNLSVCNIPPICEHIAAGKPYFSAYNASGCNGQAEVEIACTSCSSFPPLISLNDQPVIDGIYRASDEVNSTGTVPAGGNVRFEAAQTILLDNNFAVEPDADFSAEIEDCTEQ